MTQWDAIKMKEGWWCHRPLIPALEEEESGSLWVRGQLDLQNEFQDNHSYTQRSPVLNKNTQTKHTQTKTDERTIFSFLYPITETNKQITHMPWYFTESSYAAFKSVVPTI